MGTKYSQKIAEQNTRQAEAEVMPSSSLAETKAETKVEVEIGVELGNMYFTE